MVHHEIEQEDRIPVIQRWMLNVKRLGMTCGSTDVHTFQV
jgi:hypothetical protein